MRVAARFRFDGVTTAVSQTGGSPNIVTMVPMTPMVSAILAT